MRFSSTHLSVCFFFFFFNDTATTEIYTLSLHDALPIFALIIPGLILYAKYMLAVPVVVMERVYGSDGMKRSEEHTSELQSQSNLVCRLLLEKKKKTDHYKVFHAER